MNKHPSTFVTVAFRVSSSLAKTIEEHTAQAEHEDGWNEFVEAALRRSLREGWDARHQNASLEQAKKIRGEEP